MWKRRFLGRTRFLPTPAVRGTHRDRLNWVESGHTNAAETDGKVASGGEWLESTPGPQRFDPKPLKHYAAPWTCSGSEPYLFGPGVPRKQAISTKAQMPMPARTEPKIM